MRMFTIPNQSSVPKAYGQFDDDGHNDFSDHHDGCEADNRPCATLIAPMLFTKKVVRMRPLFG